MNESQINGRLGWLSGVLASQRNNIAAVLLRLKGIGVRAGTSLGLHKKFMHLLEQVACEREKELDLLHEIETIEKRHLEMKQRKLLRCAEVEKLEPQDRLEPCDPREEKPEGIGFLKLFTLFLLFGSKPVKDKNQDLTVD